MFKPLHSVSFFFAAALMLAGCETSPKSEGEKNALHDEVQATLTRMKEKDSSLNDLLNRAYGYVIFPSVAKGGLIVGGAYGRGEVLEEGHMIGFADMQQASVGLQAGGQEYSELIVFETQKTLREFKGGNFAFGANASAIALKAGASGTAQFQNGIAVFTDAKSGLMFEAAIAGQKFKFEPKP
jgi:lipid-binding SYLF domain-containing protein